MSREAMKLALEALEVATTPLAQDRQEVLRAITALRSALAEQPAQLPFGVGGGLVAIKTLLSRDPCVHANTAIQMIDAILAEQPAQQEPEYAWPAVADYERDVGFETNEAFRMAWNMARTTNKMMGITSPPARRTWVGLTDDEVEQACVPLGAAMLSFTEVSRAIEAKLKEKNT